MSHNAQALVLHCMDFRFIDGLNRWLDGQGLTNQYDRVVAAGAAKNLVDPTQPTDVEFIERQIDIAQRLHHISEVWIINHRDCGAYGKIFSTADEETARHSQDLQQAKQQLEQRFGLVVKTWLATLQSDHTITVEPV